MNRLDQFLNVAARQLRIMPAAKRDDELRELRGHLQQRAEDYANQGMSDDAAQARALEGLGSPRKLGASLCDAWEGITFSWWRLAAAITGAVTWQWSWSLLNLLTASFSDITRGKQQEYVVIITGALWSILPWMHLLPAIAIGWLFSHCLGRRGRLWAVLYFSGLIFVRDPLNIELLLTSGGKLNSLFMYWIPYIRVAAAFAGAFVAHKLKMQKRIKRQRELKSHLH